MLIAATGGPHQVSFEDYQQMELYRKLNQYLNQYLHLK